MNIMNKLDEIVQKHRNEILTESLNGEPGSKPLENFNQMLECDYWAWRQAIPNFPFNGHWWSKTRFALVQRTGQLKRLVQVVEPENFSRATSTPGIQMVNPGTYVEFDPAEWTADCADHQDWQILQPVYERLKNKNECTDGRMPRLLSTVR